MESGPSNQYRVSATLGRLPWGEQKGPCGSVMGKGRKVARLVGWAAKTGGLTSAKVY